MISRRLKAVVCQGPRDRERSVARGDRGVDPRPALRGRNQIVRRGGGKCWINTICALTRLSPGRRECLMETDGRRKGVYGIP